MDILLTGKKILKQIKYHWAAKFYLQQTLLSLSLLSTLFIVNLPVQANPYNGTIVSGNVAFNASDSNTLKVIQSSTKAIIDWESFNIDNNQITQFLQPSSDAIVLNRVVGGQVSNISGKLLANGQVVLLNPAGILFTKDAIVDVASLIVSTHAMSDQDFLAGNYYLVQPNTDTAGITNNGAIKVADYGLAALVAPGVVNNGMIVARLGKVVMAAGNTLTLDPYGDQLINFGTSLSRAAKDMTTIIANHGTIFADGGKVLLTASAVKGVVDQVINMDGIIQAHSIESHHGEIILAGGANGKVTVSGKVDASGTTAGATGGVIRLLAQDLELLSPASLDVSGDLGGGLILVGGDIDGGNGIPIATAVFVGPEVRLNADALSLGSGGKITVWSNQYTNVQGIFTAKGGASGGDGGFIETSSQGVLDVQRASILASASFGQNGTWLSNSKSVEIVDPSAASANACSVGLSCLAVADIEAALSGGTNVTIATSNTDSDAGDITLKATITDVTTVTLPILTFQAAHDIILNAPISLNRAVNIALNADHQITQNALADIQAAGGNISFNAAIIQVNGNVTDQSTGDSLSPTISYSNSIIAGLGNPSLTINADSNGIVAFGGAIGSSNNRFDVLSIAGKRITLQNNAYSNKQQNYIGAVTLATNDITLDANGGDITFNGSVDGAHALRLNTTGTVTLNSTLGDSIGLTSFSVTAGLVKLNKSITTDKGNIQFFAPVILLAQPLATTSNVTLTTDGGDILFNSTLDGISNLDLAAGTGSITFTDQLGNTDRTFNLAITSASIINLYHSIQANSITGGAAMVNIQSTLASLNDGIMLTNNNGTLNISSGIYNQAMIINHSLNTVFNNVTLDDLTTAASSDSAIGIEGNLTTNDSFFASNHINLTGDLTLKANSIIFNNNIAGSAKNLTLIGTKINLKDVGTSSARLASLSTQGNLSSYGSLYTSGNQSYQNGTLTLADNSTFDSTSGYVSIAGAVNGIGHSLTISAPMIFLGNTIGDSTNRLGAVLFTASTGIDLTGDIYTDAEQIYSGNLRLKADTILDANNSLVALKDGSVDGNFNLTLTTHGVINIADTVGSHLPLLSFTANHASQVTLGNSITTRGGAIQFSAPVVLIKDTALESYNDSITFNDTIDGNYLLSLSAGSGRITFGGLVGNAASLSHLTVISAAIIDLNNAINATRINGNAVNVNVNNIKAKINDGVKLIQDNGSLTVAAGNYSENVTITHPLNMIANNLVQMTSFTTSGLGVLSLKGILQATNITLNMPLNLSDNLNLTATNALALNNVVTGAGFSFTLSGNPITITGQIGHKSERLASFITSGKVILSNAIYTTDTLSFADPVTLAAATTVDSMEGDITFSSTIDGAHELLLATGGSINFSSAIGGSVALQNFTVSQANNVNLGSNITTENGIIDIIAPVTLTANSSLSSNGGTITLAKTVDGHFNLTLAASDTGKITLQDPIGKTIPLTQFKVTSANSVNLANNISATTIFGNANTVNVTNSNAQINDAVALVKNKGDLIVSSGIYDEAVSISHPLNLTLIDLVSLNSFTTAASGATIGIQGAVTANSITLNDPTNLTGNLSLTASAGDITLANSINGTYNLTLTADNHTVSVNAAIGNSATLSYFSVTSAHLIQLNNAITATRTKGNADNVNVNNSNAHINEGVALVKDRGNLTVAPGTYAEKVTIDHPLNLITSGTAKLNSLITTNAGDIGIEGIYTAPSMTFSGTLDLLADTSLTATTSNLILNNSVNGNYQLDLSATNILRILADLGNITPLVKLVTGKSGVTQLGADITTQGGTQIYNNPVQLLTSITLKDTGTTGITFNSTLNGNHDILFNVPNGDIIFADLVGNTTPLATMTVNSVKNLKANKTINLGSYIENQGSGIIDFGLANGLIATGDITITANKIKGHIKGNHITLNSVQALNLVVDAKQLTLSGNSGGNLTGSIGGDDSPYAARSVILAALAQGNFFFNGCPIPGGCNDISNDLSLGTDNNDLNLDNIQITITNAATNSIAGVIKALKEETSASLAGMANLNNLAQSAAIASSIVHAIQNQIESFFASDTVRKIATVTAVGSVSVAAVSTAGWWLLFRQQPLWIIRILRFTTWAKGSAKAGYLAFLYKRAQKKLSK